MKVSVEILQTTTIGGGYTLTLRADWHEIFTPQVNVTYQYSDGQIVGGSGVIVGSNEPVEMVWVTDDQGVRSLVPALDRSPMEVDLDLDVDDDPPPRRLRRRIRQFVADELTAMGMACTPDQVMVKRLDDPGEEIVAKTIRLYDGDPLGPPRLPTTVGTNVYLKRMAESVPVGSTDAETLEAILSFARVPTNLTALQWRLCAFADDGSTRRRDLGVSLQPVWEGAVGTLAGSRLSASFDLSLPAQEALAAAGRVLLVPAIRRMTTGSVNLRAAGLVSRAVVKLES